MTDDVATQPITHPTAEQLDAGLDHLRQSPGDSGTVEMIVCRPAEGERRVLDEGVLVVGEGLVGDNYLARGSRDGPAHPEAQLNLMNSRAVDLVAAGDRERWPLAGDQFFVDFDLSAANAPAGTRLAIGAAVIEVSQKPHTGCSKFSGRFGIDAARWVNAVKDDRRRGINAMVVQAGVVRPGDTIAKL
jgi:MOSC domain-containing protein YiiM